MAIAGIVGGLGLVAVGEYAGRKSTEFKKEAEITELQRDNIEVVDQDTHDWNGQLTSGAASSNFASLFSRGATYILYPVGGGILAASIVTILTGNLVYITITIVVGVTLGALRARMLVQRDGHVPKERVASQQQNKEKPKIQEPTEKQEQRVEKKAQTEVENLEEQEQQAYRRLDELNAQQKREALNDTLRTKEEIREYEQKSKRANQELTEKIDTIIAKHQQQSSSSSSSSSSASAKPTSTTQTAHSAAAAPRDTSKYVKEPKLTVDTLIKLLGSDINAEFLKTSENLLTHLSPDISNSVRSACLDVVGIKNEDGFKKNPEDHIKSLDDEINAYRKKGVIHSIQRTVAVEYLKRLIEIDGQRQLASSSVSSSVASSKPMQPITMTSSTIVGMSVITQPPEPEERVTVESLIQILGTDINKKIPKNYSETQEDPRTKALKANHERTCVAAGRIQNHADFQKDPRAHLEKLDAERAAQSEKGIGQGTDQMMAIEYLKRLVELKG